MVDWARLAAGMLLLGVLAAVVGCGPRRPETVPVHGKITFGGGPWPAKGMIIFTAVKAAEGFPRRPGTAVFDIDGQYTVTTFDDQNGLMPGTYHAMIICGEKVESMEQAGKSYVPERYQYPERSGIELTVPPDSDPIEFSFDIPKK